MASKKLWVAGLVAQLRERLLWKGQQAGALNGIWILMVSDRGPNLTLSWGNVKIENGIRLFIGAVCTLVSMVVVRCPVFTSQRLSRCLPSGDGWKRFFRDKYAGLWRERIDLVILGGL